MSRFPLILICACSLAFAVPSAASAEPLKGGVKTEDSAGTPQDALLDQMRASLQELKQLNARLERASVGGTAGTARYAFPAKITGAASKFRPNKLFAEAELPQGDTEEGWYRIPHWRAGKYHREKQTDHSITGDVTIVSRVDHVYGMQQDKNGDIWHHTSWPHITKVDLADYTEYKIIERYEPFEGAPNEFAVKVSTTDIDVDKKTNRIKRVTKQEEVDRYSPGDNSTATGECEWQGYTADGNPNTQVEHSTVEEVQTEPFRVVDRWRDKDLRASFRTYLESHGMSDLVP
jgi:hypothetical protein